MRYHALATDYDGTIARHGTVNEPTLHALRRLKDSGRKIILVTGRELPDLLNHFPHPTIFDRIIAENGALLYRPATREEKLLAQPPPPKVADLLRERGVKNLSVGRVIIATFEPYEGIVLQAIRELGLECQVIFNKGAVMLLPSGVNKATGLRVALKELNLSRHNVVGVGDAENDHAFLEWSECSVAVANALDALKERADLVTQASHGEGVSELIAGILTDDLAKIAPRQSRHDIPMGTDASGAIIALRPYGVNALVAGSSGGGKSTLVAGLLERFIERKYQTLIIDPEGDHSELEGALVLGSAKQAPTIDELAGALEKPDETVVANLISIRLEDKPQFFQRLFPRINELRSRTGRPHWIVLDEAHHVFPSAWEASANYMPLRMSGVISVTVQPSHVAQTILREVNLVVAIGESPNDAIGDFCSAVGEPPPEMESRRLDKGQAIGWRRQERATFWFETIPAKTVRRRHVRKYALGELGKEESFYFEGREKKLHLRAQNLQMFLQLAEGIDDETWSHHLSRGDYSRWLKERVKDPELSAAVARIEKTDGLTPEQTRAAIRNEIEQRYTAAV